MGNTRAGTAPTGALAEPAPAAVLTAVVASAEAGP